MPIPATLAAQADVEDQLGRTLTSGEAAKVEAALRAASAYVRRKTRRRFETGARTVIRRASRGRVTLDAPTSVEEVRRLFTDGTTEVVDSTTWTLRGGSLYGLSCSCRVEVDYTADGAVPDELVDVVAAMTARAVSAPVTAGVQSETTGPFTVRYADDAGTVTALPDEDRTIARHAMPPAPPVDLLA